jgi:hypothetical protein
LAQVQHDHEQGQGQAAAGASRVQELQRLRVGVLAVLAELQKSN